jgi:hypothetical protein
VRKRETVLLPISDGGFAYIRIPISSPIKYTGVFGHSARFVVARSGTLPNARGSMKRIDESRTAAADTAKAVHGNKEITI